MTPDHLLDHFDRISDAPDAIPRLRRFILDLAVRGKLVEQEHSDEPVSEVLKRMGAAKSDAVPFQIPSCWQWVRVGEIAECRLGKMLDKAKNKGTPRRYLRNVNVRWFDFDLSDVFEMPYEDSELDEFSIHSGDVLICEGGEPGRAAVWDEREADIYFQKAIHRVRFPKGFNPHYFVSVLRVSAESGRLAAYFTGVGIKHFTGKGLSSFLIPLPPLAEQHRIVAKVDELMALCDRLDVMQAERESRRDKLTAASLHRLNNGANTDEFRAHARFHLRHLPGLTTRVEHIQQLRQTILNLAVRGKLVPQNHNDEPASELIERIRVEKAQMVRDGKLKTVETRPPIEGELPYQLPFGWSFAQLQSLCISVTDGDHLPPPKTTRGIPFLVIGDVRNKSIEFAGSRHVSEEYFNALDPIRRPQRGDVLYTLVGSFGIPITVVDDRPFCVQRHIGILRPSKLLHVFYLSRALESQFVFDQAAVCATGIAQKTVPLSGLRRILIPLPPLVEQNRIVAKVDELTALCDELEAQLTTAQTESHRLLEAVLAEVLAT